MRLPQNGYFVDGNPLGGTIVRAAVMNGLIGELVALLALEGLEPLEAGELPADHTQVADMLAKGWVRIRETGGYPTEAEVNSVLLDPQLLIAGEWPFKVFRNGTWEDTTLPAANDEPTPEEEEDSTTFNDVEHGQRGGGDLHAPASEEQAGFLSAVGFQTLTALGASRPRFYTSAWTSVSAGQVLSFTHGLSVPPTFIQVQFRASAESTPVLATPLFNAQLQFCGPTIDQITDSTLRVIVGTKAWAGMTPTGLQAIESGQYQVSALVHGN